MKIRSAMFELLHAGIRTDKHVESDKCIFEPFSSNRAKSGFVKGIKSCILTCSFIENKTC
jgi:hypothetical protein